MHIWYRYEVFAHAAFDAITCIGAPFILTSLTVQCTSCDRMHVLLSKVGSPLAV